jgi:hypothetical protein
MGRLNQERQNKMEPILLKNRKLELESMGFKITQETTVALHFDFNGEKVIFYPYSGWHTGKSIKDGRGWDNLLKQIKPKQ